MVWFTDAYVRHSASVSYSAVGVPFYGVSIYVDFFRLAYIPDSKYSRRCLMIFNEERDSQSEIQFSSGCA